MSSKKIKSKNEIAIIGMSCRFPGASTVEKYWEHLSKGNYLIQSIPQHYWDFWTSLLNPFSSQNKMYCTQGGFLEEVAQFDADFFGISEREARSMDPQLRLLLEVLWETLEDAGYAGEMAKSNTGFYLGNSFSDYEELLKQQANVEREFIGIANAKSMLANRASHFLDLRGPSLTVDTACSSSLVALRIACNDLLSGACEQALVGGVNLNLSPNKYLNLCAIYALSQKGEMNPFDLSADGYIPADGVASVLLKPLAQAIEEKDQIYGVIEGLEVHSGGKTVGPIVPNPEQQQAIITNTWKKAQINPEEITYFETHGVSSKLGDPLEIRAIQGAFAEFTRKKHFCAFGTAKANIGHTEATSGLAGLIKVLLQLKFKKIPSLPRLNRLNPLIQLDDTPLYLNETLIKWKAKDQVPKRAAINTFGIGGTYSHLVVREYIPPKIKLKKIQSSPQWILLSARTSESLKNSVFRLSSFLNSNPKISLKAIAYNLQIGREQLEFRLAILAHNKQDLLHKLNTFLEEKRIVPNLYYGRIPEKNSKEQEEQLYWQQKKMNKLERLVLMTKSNTELFEENETIAEQNKIKKALKQKDYPLLLEYWLNGKKIEWKHLYSKSEKEPKLSLPTYPFEKKRYWIEKFFENRSENLKKKTINSALLHQNTLKLVLQHLGGKDLSQNLLSNPQKVSLPTYPFKKKRHWIENFLENRSENLKTKARYSPLLHQHTLKLVLQHLNDKDLSQTLLPGYLPQKISLPIYPFEKKRYWIENFFEKGIEKLKEKTRLSSLLHQNIFKLESQYFNDKDLSQALLSNPQKVSLPTYPFKKKRHWIENVLEKGAENLKRKIRYSALLHQNTFKLALQHLEDKDLSQALLSNPQKVSLPTYPFSKKKCWLNSIIPSGKNQNKENVVSTTPNTFETSLTFEEQRILNRLTLYPETLSLLIPCAIRIKGFLDIEKFKKSLELLVSRHENLRTVFEFKNDEFKRRILFSPGLNVPFKSLVSHNNQQQEIQKYLTEMQQVSFSIEKKELLFRVCLLQLSECEYVFIVTLHHLIADVWSSILFFHDLLDIYHQITNGERAGSFQHKRKQFSSYLKKENQKFTDEIIEKRLPYWKSKIGSDSYYLPLSHNNSKLMQRKSSKSISKEFPKELSAQITLFCKKQKITPFSFLLSILKVLLYGITQQKNIVVAVPLFNRNDSEEFSTIGLYAWVSAIISELDDELQFSNLLKNVKTGVMKAQENLIPFSKLSSLIFRNEPERNKKLIQVVFSYVNDILTEEQIPDLKIEHMDTNHCEIDFELWFIILRRKEKDFIQLQYLEDLFAPDEIEKIMQSFFELIKLFLNDPNKKISNIFQQTPFEKKETLVITSTFTAEPIHSTLSFWPSFFKKSVKIKYSPYNQVFQEIIQNKSLFQSNKKGANFLLLRFEDWLERQLSEQVINWTITKEALEKSVREFADLLENKTLEVPIFIVECKESPFLVKNKNWLPIKTCALKLLRECCKKNSDVHFISSKEIDSLYPVKEYYNPDSFEIGRVPYTEKYYVALGTILIRKYSRLKAPPIKVIVLDGDNTLWQGVIAEEGLEGIRVDKSKKLFQNFVLNLQKSGILLALCSKNQKADVLQVLNKHSEMQLKKEHFVAIKANWENKSKNISELAEELNLGLDSFIFIDDNPIECQEVEQNLPGILVFQMPQKLSAVQIFIEHVWAFDRLKTTVADHLKTKQYKEHLKRTSFKNNQKDLREFIQGLELKIKIDFAKNEEIARISQLTQKTNQFNFTTIRRTESEIKKLANEKEYTILSVKVEDRFGDYGLVGVLILRQQNSILIVDTFLLSCRVLGREVEINMLQGIGKIATKKKCKEICITLIPTSRNEPARKFLVEILGKYETKISDKYCYQIPAETEIKRNTQAPVKFETEEHHKKQNNKLEIWQKTKKIYETLFSVDLIHNKVKELYLPKKEKQHKIEKLQNETEKKLKRIWSEILRQEVLSRNDDFFELGGFSIDAVTLISSIRKSFNVPLTYEIFLEKPTIAKIAEQIDCYQKQYCFLNDVTTKTNLIQKEALNSNSLVRIQPNETKKTLFFVPGIGGTPLTFKRLSQNLGEEQHFYGLDYPGLNGQTKALESVESIAKYFITIIKSVQKEGPYLLGGHSFGGTVAYEIARQFQKEKEKIQTLILLDSQAPSKIEKPITSDWDDVRWILEFARIHHMDLKQTEKDLKKLKKKEQLSFLKKHLEEANLIPKISFEFFSGLFKVAKLLSKMDYYPKSKTSAKMVLIRAKEVFHLFQKKKTTLKTQKDLTLGWHLLTSVPIETHFVPGDHFSILNEPYVKVLAKKIQPYLT